ncbi:MAG: methionine--tRNA ligase [Clostridia bacterium]|nr:methionine--tRNA ligase [Clostridia bacterium]
MKEKFYITTAIAYTSKKPHIGNTYEAVLTDAIARYKRLRGYDVYFLTGTDEHGQKIQQEAEAAGITPQAYVDKVAGEIKSIWDMFNVSYDKFIRTTDEEHVKCVQKIFNKLYEQGDIYKGTYEGNYCTPCESFWTDTQLVDGKCPDCGRDCKKASEEAYFLKMSKYADRLVEYYNSHDEFITPVSRKNEMINNFIKPGLQDLCVSRTSFTWGIPVTFDERHVTYVWLDALSNYITAIGFDIDNPSELYKKLWPADVQVIGKDIVRFHTIYWPIILMALGLPLPKQILAHPWLLSGIDKMSKSRGNVIYGDDLIAQFGLDPVRHYLLAEMGYYNDGSITYENLIKRTNSDLANVLGNLVSRTGAMIKQYFGGVIPKNSGNDDEFAVSLKTAIKEGFADTVAKYDKYLLADADAAIFNTLKACNKYIDETTPWVLAKDPEKKQALADVLSNLVESIRICNILLEPLMPDTAKKINAIFNVPEQDFESARDYNYCCEGVTLGEIPILFARIDEKKLLAEIEAKEKEAKKAAKEAEKNKKKSEKTDEKTEIIGIEDFAKVDLRVGIIKECVKAENSDKLLVLQLDMGGEIRQVVSGIAKYYTPEELIGKKVIVVSNLKPVKLRGIDSNGMILAADTENGVKVIFADENANPGSKVR